MSEKEIKKLPFEERVKSFFEKYNSLQKEYGLLVLPVITSYGPDLQIKDLLTKISEEKKDSSEVLKKV